MMQLLNGVIFVQDLSKLLNIVFVSHFGKLLIHHEFINSLMYRLTSHTFNADFNVRHFTVRLRANARRAILLQILSRFDLRNWYKRHQLIQ